MVVKLVMKNIKPGYAEIWGNSSSGQRYRLAAVVKRLDNGGWHWLRDEEHAGMFGLPENYVAQPTRRECVRDCIRAVLLARAERAIAMQPRESEHWNSPRRMALRDMRESGMFTYQEMVEMRRRMELFSTDGVS